MANPLDGGLTVPAVRAPTDPALTLYTAADHQIDAATSRRLAGAVPENTRETYALIRATFQQWCDDRGRVALPATPQTLTSYVSAMIEAGRAPATISQHMGAIRTWHRTAGHDKQPENSGARLALRGYRRARALAGEHDREAAPILLDTLRAMVDTLDLATVTGKRDHALLVVGFSMMARRSELVALRLNDLVDTPQGIDAHIRTSKTDKDSRGAVVGMPRKDELAIDPVRAVRAWRAVLARYDYVAGPFLRGVGRHGIPRATALQPATVNEIVQRLARAAKLRDPHLYSAHSLRAGGFTAALLAGVPLGVAARHGRWSLNSPVLNRYARVADRWQNNAMAAVQ